MADKKISELVNLTSLATDDEFVVVDKGANATKRITATNLSKFPSGVTVPDGGTIGSASDADAITIDATGNVALSQALQLGDSTAISSLGADVWRLTANATSSGTLTAWERADDQSNVKVGSGVSVASGVFTLPSTGYWLIFLVVVASNDDAGGDDSVNGILSLGIDTIGITLHNSVNTGGRIQTSGSVNALIDVTNTSTQTIVVSANSVSGANSAINGSSSNNQTSIAFLRVGDT